MSRFRHALVLGKFYPPHAGHHHVIRTAAAGAERTTVAVLGSSVESIPIADRVRWLAAEHARDPGVAVLGDLDDHPMDYHDDAIWELHVGVARAVLARRAIHDGDPAAAPVDAVYSSEEYGPELAKRLDATHVPVDPARTVFPVSGTAVRARPFAHWSVLAAPTRAGLAARVVVVGAESTGTTTLANDLAAHYRRRGGAFASTTVVPEYGRTHTGHKLAAARAFDPSASLESLVWTVGDFVDVAARQAADEDAAAGASPILVCDNDSWAATVWCERYLGSSHPDVETDRRPHLYLLTDHVGVPYEQDGWRDGEHVRGPMTALFVRGLCERGVPWALVAGNRAHRLRQAVRLCDEVLRRRFTFTNPLQPPLP
ncbi:AAA family ATPase [Labedaea rhizosphaerae]|uniref:NadR type nicotinamide-nucleotide adenylyltransferase n=1 Tax=Labedaea rhizosphaerae TaxID=598644 RepID=A0A4R6SHE8_LABRH|nr:AAA family ATPase [Labedaea rhizosphaerae]TDQ01224.1 NadR type nicotinamide-nucleotide adenylyltransferase [Labedaea rhizosphaerae]